MSTRDDEKIEEYITAAICEEESVPTKTPSSISQGPNLFENRHPFLFSCEKKIKFDRRSQTETISDQTVSEWKTTDQSVLDQIDHWSD